MESFVAIMALCAASILEPGVYFAMNVSPAVLGSTVDSAAQVINGWGFVLMLQGKGDEATVKLNRAVELSRSQ